MFEKEMEIISLTQWPGFKYQHLSHCITLVKVESFFFMSSHLLNKQIKNVFLGTFE